MSWYQTKEGRSRLGRLPLVALAMVSLLAAIWGGLLRMGLNLPLPSNNANWISYHGPLMVCGFLGTVIGLERAVGLRRGWTYIAPALTAAGSLLLVAGGLGKPGPALITLGSAVFAGVAWRIVGMQRVLFTTVMAIGATVWFAGNVLWLAGWDFPRLVPWWIAFLALTITGERLELSRFQRLPPQAKPIFLSALALFLYGVVLSAAYQDSGQRAAGLGLAGMGLWLGRFDIARRTIRQRGLPRFMAASLLSGYFWMIASGLLLCGATPLQPGSTYDAALHCFFLGFVFSMIFGHAPVIFPAVFHLPASFSRRYYAHLILLHASLILRVTSDLAAWNTGRAWGGSLNGIAIALFILNTLASMALPPSPAPNRRKS